MSSISDLRRRGSPLAVRLRPPRLLRLAPALALVFACTRDANRPQAPFQELHYPAWLGTTTATEGGLDQKLFVVNLDQDLAFDQGSVVSLDAMQTTSTPPDRGLPVPSMAGKLLVVDDRAAAGCATSTEASPSDFQPPFLLVAGRTDQRLVKIPLALPLADQQEESIDLTAQSASSPFGVGLSCSPSPDGASGTPRAWVSYLGGRDGKGYIAQVDFSQSPARRTEVYTGFGHPREFAYDLDHDRLYFTTEQYGGKAPVRWLTVGTGCKSFDGGVQDERKGGCHVDPGFDLSTALSGAEPNELALSSGMSPCTMGRYKGQLCRRMYLSVRVFDYDQYKALGDRPSGDVGGKLVVLELPESSLGGPDPQWIRGLDIGVKAGPLLVIPRTGQQDLVAVLAVEDGLLWLYDDEVGALVKVFARDPNTGVPDLGHFPSGLAVRPAPGSTDADPRVRIYVSSYHDNWVSAVDVPVDHPADASVVKDDAGSILRLGVTP